MAQLDSLVSKQDSGIQKTSIVNHEDLSERIHSLDSLSSMPHPIGGIEKFYKALKDSIVYPETDREKETEGRVYLQFIIEKDGSVANILCYPGTEELGTEAMNKAAITALKKSAKWKPGKQNGRHVRVRYVILIEFKITE